MAVVSGTGSSQGVTLKKGATTILFVNSIDGLEVKANTLDTTSLDVANGGYKTFIGGMKEVSDVSISGYYSPKDHDAFVADFNSGTSAAYTITFPALGGGTAALWSFNAIVTGFKHKSSVDSVITVDVTLKVSGAPTFTAAT